MARYKAAFDTPREREDVFAYLSDFSTTEEWDPGVVEAERLDDAAVGEGTEFRLVAEFLGRKTELTYRIVEYDPAWAVTFRGENASVISNDRITFESAGDCTRIHYDAELALKGPLRIADPLLGLAFNRVGERALAGLKRKLGPARTDQLGPMTGRALDGRAYDLPADLAKPYSILVVAFRREQQTLVDGWLPWLMRLEQRRADVAAYEVPVLSSIYSPARRFIDGGMARGVSDPAARARTITIYTDVAEVVESLGLSGTDTIGVLVLKRGGLIVARQLGGFDQQKAQRLATALTPEPPARAAAA